MTLSNKEENPITLKESKRAEFKLELIGLFEDGINGLKNSHVRQLAEEEIYNELGIGFVMGYFDSIGLGYDEDVDIPAIRIRIAKKVGQAPDLVFQHLDNLVQERIAKISATFDTGKFGENLEALKRFSLDLIDRTKTTQAGYLLSKSCNEFILRSVRAHPHDEAPDIDEEKEELSWIGTNEEYNLFSNRNREPEESDPEDPDPAPELDDEIPF